ncbi:two-component system response regulator [Nanoarchaeota archaeon]
MENTILLVDDEPDNVETIKTVLKQNGYKVVTACSGDDCLKKLKKHKVNLILMDIMMPGTPVRDIISKIKGVKIAYLTVVRTSEAEREELMKKKNIVDYIQKPFDIDDLLERVKRILG